MPTDQRADEASRRRRRPPPPPRLPHDPPQGTLLYYEALVQKYARPVPQRSLLKCCSESLAVVQEFALSVFFVARHRLSRMQWEAAAESREMGGAYSRRRQQQRHVEARLDWAHGLILVGFCLVLVARGSRRSRENDQKNNDNDNNIPAIAEEVVVVRRRRRQAARTKARHRLTDACVLGVLLRLFASVLRRLTASYSTDTVQALGMACMGLHLLTCDYTYSSGNNNKDAASQATNNTTTTTTTMQSHENRPPFRGGTVSLNASFFATVLFISRLESDYTSYFFCSLAVIFFGFYPQARADLLAEFPPHTNAANWWITVALLVATYILLDGQTIRHAYCLAIVALLLVLPSWRCASQRYKRRLDGPWSMPTNLSCATQKPPKRHENGPLRE